ncbi:hypothetical protein EX30DRAFT_173899 [Ascodesmis nigricans]|uniref:Uncharacterized protein n=1 Tax=Ascodesmis nigricans TaxID=341454 RepID=A0A4S2MLV8_9PEZI|nr:hypothetical protein EX30DRAFT_173899 [Ascodesmis nigricans]
MASLLEQFLSQPSECHQKTKLEQPPHAHAHTTAASRRRYPFALAAHPSSSRILFPGRSDRKKINLLTPMDQQIPLPDSILDDDQFYSLVSFYVSKISDTRRNDVETISSNQTTGPQSAVWTGTANHNVMLPAIREDFVEGIENPLHPLQTKVSTAVLSAGSGEFNLFHEHGIILGEGNHPDELETIAKYLRDSLSDVEVMADAQHHPCASFAYAIKGIGTSSACLFSKNRFRE